MKKNLASLLALTHILALTIVFRIKFDETQSFLIIIILIYSSFQKDEC